MRKNGDKVLEAAAALRRTGSPLEVALAVVLAFDWLAKDGDGATDLVSAAQITEATWLALRRGDGKALARGANWANQIIAGRTEEEQVSAAPLMRRHESIEYLLARAKVYLQEHASPTCRPFGVSVGSNIGYMMPSEVALAAPWLCNLPRDYALYSEAKAKVADELNLKELKGPLDAPTVVRATLRAFGKTGPQIAALMKFKKAAAKRSEKARVKRADRNK